MGLIRDCLVRPPPGSPAAVAQETGTGLASAYRLVPVTASCRARPPESCSASTHPPFSLQASGEGILGFSR